VKIEALIPAGGFFPQYLKWVERLTDAPGIYHVSSALAVLSAVASPFVKGKFDFVAQDGSMMSSVFPTHLWSLIVGPSGDRKSTAMKFGIAAGAPVIPDISEISGSPEAAFSMVAQKPNVMFYHSEGSTLFSQLQASYWQQGQGFLCDLYDGREYPPYKRTLSGIATKKEPNPQVREITITKPRVTMLIGIAPDLLDQSRKSDWTGGLIGRMLVVYGECARYDETPERDDRQGMMMQTAWLSKLQHDLFDYVRGNGGQEMDIKIRPEALQTYMNWARDLNAATQSRPAKIRPLFRRLPVHVIRVACLYAVSQYHDMITLETMLPAIRLGDYSRRSIERVGDLLADDIIMRNAVRIRDMLSRAPNKRLSVQEISDQLRMSWATIEPAIRTLTTAGRAKIRMDEENAEAKVVQLIVPKAEVGQQPWGTEQQ
jgi:hypothetical protein